jgi:hypothetical protein
MLVLLIEERRLEISRHQRCPSVTVFDEIGWIKAKGRSASKKKEGSDEERGMRWREV